MLLAFGPLTAALARFNAISEEFAEPMDDDKMNALLAEQSDLQEKIDAEDGWDLDRRIEIALDALRCPPPDANVARLSGGERRRVALCRLLLEKPDLLLLDEPTNHLDAESVAWLERTLRDFAGTVMIVTHDRYFLDNVTNWILEIERGRGYPFEGNYSSWLRAEAEAAAAGGKGGELPPARPGRRGGVDPEQPTGTPDQEPRPHRQVRGDAAEVARDADWSGGDRHPAGSAAGRAGHRGGAGPQGVRQPAADGRPGLQAAARRHRRRDRAERRRQDDAVPHDHRGPSTRTRARSRWATP